MEANSIGRHGAHSVSEDTPRHHQTLLTVVQLCGGAFLWLAFARIPHDYRSLRRRRPAWVLLTLYLLCQYVTVLSVLLEMVHVCTFPRPFSVPLGNAALGLRRLSLLSGFGIMLLRVNSLWNHALVSTLTSTSLLAFLGVIGLQLSELEIVYLGNKQDSFVSLLLYTSTLIFVLGILGVLNVRKRSIHTDKNQSHSTPSLQRSEFRLPVPDTVMETWALTLHWLCTVLAATVYFAFQHMDPHYRRAIGFAGCLVGVHTAAWEYDKLAKEDVEIFFTPLKFFLEWWKEVRGASAQPGTSSTQRLRPTQSRARDGSPPYVGELSSEVFELKALSTDGLERRKSPGDSGPDTVTEEGSMSMLSSPSCARPPAVEQDRWEAEDGDRS